MERKSSLNLNCMSMRFVVILFIFLFSLGFKSTLAQNSSSYDCKFYEAYISGNMTNWPFWIDELEAAYERGKDSDVLYQLVKAYYGYVAFLIGEEKETRAEKYIEEAENYIQILKETDKYRSYSEAMDGAFIAYKIGLNEAKAIFLGPKSMKHIKRAIKIKKDNPYALVEMGNAEFHMPRYLGGSYDLAAENFKKAVHIFENEHYSTKCNWVYLNALAWLAQSYDKAGRAEKARQTYRKILSVEPEFTWVRDELYPEFQKSSQ